DTTTLTLNDVSVNEGTGTATVGGSLDYAPQTTLVVTLSNGSTITFGPDYVAGTTVQSTPFAIQTDDVYKDGETYEITVTGTTGGNFENLVTTDKATVTVTDTKDTTTLTLNDVSVNEGTGTATVGGSLDYAPQTTLVVTLSNGSTITFGPDYVAGTTVQSTPFAIQTDDVYKDGETYEITVTGTTGGNFENLVTTDKATVTVTDTIDPTTVTITAAKVTDKVITKDNFENHVGFTVTAKNADGTVGVIAKNDNPSGFGVANHDGSGENVNISGAPSEIGMTKDGKSESIEVEFKNPVHELNVAFAWRATQESAKVDFYDEKGNKVGHAIIFGGDGSVGSTTIQYYNKDEVAVGEPQKVQGGTDNVDLVYTFKPAGDVSFTKAVFSAIDNGKDFGQQSDYLIHSISYKEVSDGTNTTIVGSDEVAFKIATSNIPDPSKYDFINTFPTADVKIVDKNTGEVLFNGTVNLDKDGKAIVTVRTDGTKDLKAEVSNVQGNFEEVDYKNAKTEVEASIKATASNDSFDTLEDTNYVLKTTDFGDNNQNVAKIKFDTIPENGTIYVLKSEYTGSMNDRAEYTSSENKVYIEVKAGDIVDISKIENGNVVFVPNKDTDADSSFNFSVSNGNGNFSESYETKINVIAVADAPEVSINITKVGETTISTGNNGNGNSGSNTKIDRLAFEEYKLAQEPSNATIIDKNDSNYTNANAGNDTIKFTGTFNNGNTVDTGAGDDYVYFNQTSNVTLNLGEGDNQAHFNGGIKGSITAGSGDDEVRINNSSDNINIDLGDGKNNLYIKNFNGGSFKGGDGDNKLVVEQNAKGTINLGDGNNTISLGGINKWYPAGFSDGNFEGSIITGKGNDNIIIAGNINGINNSISTGAGNDFVQIHGEINNQFGKVDLGEGDDGFRYEPTNWNAGNENAIDGGKGFDTLYLKGNSTEYRVYVKNEILGYTTEFRDFQGNYKAGIYAITWDNFVKLNQDIEGFAQKEFYIMHKDTSDTNRALKVTNFESVSFGDGTIIGKEETSTVYKYDITVNVALKDTDRSEKLSDVTIKNIPNGSVLSGENVTDNKDGSYTVKVDPEKGGELKLSLTSESEISQDKLDGVQVSATSTDTPTDGQEASSKAISFDGRGDIDLSNLKNITEINLDNGKENKLSLTLEDVLKMSGDDNTIKISGDASDKVALKGENDWTKSQSTITEDNKTFDVYSGSIGDQTVQVKVEQPISDGITS
ncbi:immunoglobulin-like domain-containing protein, partial [Aliarcobacter cryaerophilus]|uniref:immunoglobulin-like domain-containing protein n=1 Tax=Aliarcobacter cryaerophilus TaxID=28198 RepID=UPI0021B1682D